MLVMLMQGQLSCFGMNPLMGKESHQTAIQMQGSAMLKKYRIFKQPSMAVLLSPLS